MIKLENVSKIYSTNNNLSVGIRKVNLEFKRGEFVAITGESGSGKSTLLNIISGIDTYEEGEMYVAGEETSYFGIEDLEDYRNKYVGFIFQNYNVIDSYTVLENVEAALLFLNYSKEDRVKKAKELIEKVGLTHRLNTKASKLSGGEKQRTVIARALAKDPIIIAADEPTGNLDSKSSKEVIELLHELSSDKLVLIVTHDFSEVQDYATRLIRVYDSEIKDDIYLKDVKKDELPNLFEEPKIKPRFKNIIDISFKDLFSSFKRFIFYFIVFFALCVSSLISLVSYKIGEEEIGESATSMFSNSDSTRVVLNKFDKKAFTKDEIDALKKLDNVKSIYYNDVYLDETANVYYETETEYFSSYDCFFRLVDDINSNELTMGSMPSNENEVVLTLSSLYMNYYSITFEDLIGKEVSVNSHKCIVTGIIDKDTLSQDRSPYVYITNELMNKISVESIVYNSSISILDVDSYIPSSYYDIIYDNELVKDDNTIYLYTWSNDSLDQGRKYSLEIKDTYHSIKLDDMTIIISNIGKANTDKYDVLNENTMIVSENTYNKIRDLYCNEIYQVSIFTNFNKNTESLRDNLRSMGYNAVAPRYDVPTVDIFGALTNILSAIYITSFIVSIIIEIFLVYLIMRHSVKSKNTDFEVLRTIGASKKNINSILFNEMILTSLIAYLFTIICYALFYFVSTGIVKDYLSLVTTIDFVLLLGMSFVFPVALSCLFSKRIFNKSVRASLNERRN